MKIESLLDAYLVSEEEFAPGEAIIQEGTMGDWIYLLMEGKAKVTKQTTSGTVVMENLKEGAIFGEIGLLGSINDPRSVSVIAGDVPVKAGLLDGQQMRRDYEKISPELRLVFKTLAKRLRQANDKVAALVVDLKWAENMKP
jgi:CRP/FNR family cyclic AMP-dependent transcriptional regulator